MSARLGSWVVVGIGMLVAASTLYILFVPIDAANFASATGVEWSDVTASVPEAAAYLEREARLLAVGYLTLGVVASVVAWRPLRNGDRWARAVLYLFSLALVGAAAVFLADGDMALGPMYLGAGLVSVASVWLASRSVATPTG